MNTDLEMERLLMRRNFTSQSVDKLEHRVHRFQAQVGN